MSEETRSLIKVQGNTLAVIEAATVGVAKSESEKRALVLQNTGNWLKQLLDEWTVPAQEQEIAQPSDERGPRRKASNHYSVPAAKTGEMDETTGDPQSPSSERVSTQYAARGGEKTDVNIGQFTHRRKPSVKRSHGEPTPTRNHDFPQQPKDSNGRFQQRDGADEEAQKATFDTMRAFQSMKNRQSQAFPAPPPRSSPHPAAPRSNTNINTPPTGVPPQHHRNYEHFLNVPQPGFLGTSRAASTRKPAAFSPRTPGGDEPMAQRTSVYTHHSPRRESYFPKDDTPHSPTMARPEPATSPLRKSQSSTGLNDATDHPPKPELNRPSTRYANRGGEKTYVNGVGRSSSVRSSPVEREWIGHKNDSVRKPHFYHDSSARHRSASPNLRDVPSAEALSSSESEYSSDTEPESFASGPKDKPRPQREETETGAFAFRHATSDGTALNDQLPSPNPRDEYTARYEYPPPPPRSDPRYFPEPQPYHKNGNLMMDDIGQHARHVSSGETQAHPNVFSGVHEPSGHPYPQPRYQSVSQEGINTTFSAADWDGKFNSGDEHFRPTSGREKKSPSRTSRTRARSVGKGRMSGNSEPIDLTSDSDAPQAPDASNPNGSDQASMPTAQAFPPGKFSAEEWAAKLKDQRWAVPSTETSSSQVKTPQRPQPGKSPTEEWAAKLKDQMWAVPSTEMSGSQAKTLKRPSESN